MQFMTSDEVIRDIPPEVKKQKNNAGVVDELEDNLYNSVNEDDIIQYTNETEQTDA